MLIIVVMVELVVGDVIGRIVHIGIVYNRDLVALLVALVDVVDRHLVAVAVRHICWASRVSSFTVMILERSGVEHGLGVGVRHCMEHAMVMVRHWSNVMLIIIVMVELVVGDVIGRIVHVRVMMNNRVVTWKSLNHLVSIEGRRVNRVVAKLVLVGSRIKDRLGVRVRDSVQDAMVVVGHWGHIVIVIVVMVKLVVSDVIGRVVHVWVMMNNWVVARKSLDELVVLLVIVVMVAWVVTVIDIVRRPIGNIKLARVHRVHCLEHAGVMVLDRRHIVVIIVVMVKLAMRLVIGRVVIVSGSRHIHAVLFGLLSLIISVVNIVRCTVMIPVAVVTKICWHA